MTTKRRLCGEGPHYVYYLYDAEGLLADIGRSVNPQGRKRAKEKMWGESFTMKVSKPIDAIEDACNKERSELRKYRPRLSRIAMSAKEREEKELLSSGWGHPRRLASLDAQTRLLVESVV